MHRVRAWVCAVEAPRLHFQRESEVVLHPGTCCWRSLPLQSLADPEWAFLVKACCLGEAPKGPWRQCSAPAGLLGGVIGAPLESGHCLGSGKDPSGHPSPPYCDSSHSAMTCGLGDPGCF